MLKGKSPASDRTLLVGIDVVEIKKVRKVFGGETHRWDRVFTPKEIRGAMQDRRPFHHLARCFAAKEAAFKALGTGLSGKMEWRDVEVRKEGYGKLLLYLEGRTAQIANEQGVVEWHFSWSWTDKYAVGFVLLVQDTPKRAAAASSISCPAMNPCFPGQSGSARHWSGECHGA